MRITIMRMIALYRPYGANIRQNWLLTPGVTVLVMVTVLAVRVLVERMVQFIRLLEVSTS